MSSISNDYFILSNNYDVSLTQITVPGIGTYSSVICLSNNSITFTDKCIGLSAECLLICSGNNGFPGWGSLSANPFGQNGAGSGGSGGGHLYGNIFITQPGGTLPYNTVYDISLVNHSYSLLNDPSGTYDSIFVATSFGHNYFDIEPYVNNFSSADYTSSPLGGTVSRVGPLYVENGGNGGNGGSGFVINYDGVGSSLAQDGSNADIGNTGLPGKYIFNQVGNIYIGGGAGGGGGSNNPPATPEGTGGEPGSIGNGGAKGIPGGDGSTDSNGGNAIYNFTNGGAGGGGGGIPLDQTTYSDKGNPSGGIFFLQVFDPDPIISTSISNDYIILSSNYDASLTQIYVPGVGTYATAVCLSNNQIKFKPHAMCCSANLLLVGGGGSGFIGIYPQGGDFAPNEPQTYAGGGGGGAAHFYGDAEITYSSGIFPYNQVYDISVATGGEYAFTSPKNGEYTYFGGNYFSPINTPYVSGGSGGGGNYTLNPINTSNFGAEGNIVNSGIFTQIPLCGNNGGNGGYGAYSDQNVGFNTNGVSSYTPQLPIMNALQSGKNAGNGNTGNPGEYNIPQYGTIYIGGGGAGGDISGINLGVGNFKGYPGFGGVSGNGIGGLGSGPGGAIGNGLSNSVGQQALHDFYNAGGGGGGGGGPFYAPLDDIGDEIGGGEYVEFGRTTNSMGGNGSGGLFLIQVFDPLPPPPLPPLPNPPPPPSPPLSPLTTDLFYFGVNEYAYTQQTLMPNGDLYAFGICLSNNTITFTPEAFGCSATMLLIGGGGGGGGGYNSRFPGAGGGGGGGGQLYGISNITEPGGALPTLTAFDISLGLGGIAGRGPYEGKSGGLSIFGENYYGYSVAPKVSGGQGGGGTIDNSNNGGISGSVLTYGPFSDLGSPGTGGNGGDGYKCWTAISAPTNGLNSNAGIYIFNTYGIISAGGGGGGGGGSGGPFCVEDDISAGFGGNAGNMGLGGNAGTAGGDGTNDSVGESALYNYFFAGGGGGGGGLPNFNTTQYDVSGGYGSGGLFAIEIYKRFIPPNPSECPCPILYKPLVTCDNNPQMFPGNRYAQYVRSSLGRPGYQRPRYGNRELSPFGYWQGAPSGYGKPPQNSFV